MAFHHGLHGVLSRQHTERELTLEVTLHRACHSTHLTAVHQEAGTLYGDARTAVLHFAGEAHALHNGEVAARLMVRQGIEGHGEAVLTVIGEGIAGDTVHRQLVGTLLVAPVGQLLYAVEAALVGGDTLVLVGVCTSTALRSGDAHTGDAGAVGKAHIALHLARLHTTAGHNLTLGDVPALTVVDRLHLVLVVEHRRHRLVHILQVGHRGDGLPSAVGGRVAAHHLEVVHGVFGLQPRQHHRTLLGLGLQRLFLYLAQTLIIKGGTVGF